LLDRTTKRVVRVGFAVNRGVRTAVERNRGRRWTREAYRRNKALLSNSSATIVCGANVVFLLRMRGDDSRKKEFRKSVDQAMIILLGELRGHLAGQP